MSDNMEINYEELLPSLFATETMEERIQFLETQVLQLETELETLQDEIRNDGETTKVKILTFCN